MYPNNYQGDIGKANLVAEDSVVKEEDEKFDKAFVGYEEEADGILYLLEANEGLERVRILC